MEIIYSRKAGSLRDPGTKNKNRRLRAILTAYVLGVMVMILPNCSYGQDSTQYIPDGTQGEQLEVIDSTKVPTQWKDKRWRLFPGKFSSLKFGGGFLYEFAGFSQNAEGKAQMDSLGTELKNAFAVRDFRITASGKLRSKRTISWKAGFMYDDANRSWFVRETGIMVGVPELWGSVFVGRTKEGFSMSKVMVGYAGWTPERQMALDVIPILADGVKWLAFLPKQRIWWNVGIYTDWLSEGQSFSTYKWQTAARFGWLPVYSPGDNVVFHVGANCRYGQTKGGEIRVRSRPEADPAPQFIDTGKFPTDHSVQVGGEAYFRSGPFMTGSEVYVHRFHSIEASDPVFIGGDIMVSYFLTGESRPYNTATGIFGFVPVNKPVFKGGPGAWEVLLRYSSLDLSGGTLQGGKFWRITPMVNWYLSKDVRLALAYGYGILDRFNLKGATQFFQARIQLTQL
jgi:phosphate-selective porin OprO/OprP